MDGDLFVVMCYIEVRLFKLSGEMLVDIEKEIVDFVWNFDDIEKELIVFLVWYLNFLVNGLIGIFVGYVIEILIYNLVEVIDGIIYMIDYL